MSNRDGLSKRGEVRYLVRVKNQTGDPIEADSLVVVVHQLRDMVRSRDVLSPDSFEGSVEFIGSDGTTKEGKPYYHIPAGDKSTLPPYSVSESITIEIQNPNLFRLYPPVLRVRGVRRTTSQDFQNALETLVHRGILTPEEAENAMKESP